MTQIQNKSISKYHNLKCIIKVSAYLIFLIGLIILGFGIYVLYKQVGLHYSDLYFNTANWLKTLQEYGFIVFGVLIIIIGLAGVQGASKKKISCRKCWLLIYQIGALTFFILCTGLSIFTLIYSNDAFGKECTGTDYFASIDSQIQLAQQVLCSSQCQCYITEHTLNLNQSVFVGKNYTTDENVDDKIEQIQKCPDFEVDEYAAAVQMMQAAEQILHCTGWCTPTSYYIFSDINDDSYNGQSCFKETKEFVESNGKILGYVLLGLGILFGFNVLFVIILCCKSEKKVRNDYLMYET